MPFHHQSKVESFAESDQKQSEILKNRYKWNANFGSAYGFIACSNLVISIGLTVILYTMSVK